MDDRKKPKNHKIEIVEHPEDIRNIYNLMIEELDTVSQEFNKADMKIMFSKYITDKDDIEKFNTIIDSIDDDKLEKFRGIMKSYLKTVYKTVEKYSKNDGGDNKLLAQKTESKLIINPPDPKLDIKAKEELKALYEYSYKLTKANKSVEEVFKEKLDELFNFNK